MDWYVKFIKVPTGTPTNNLVEIIKILIEYLRNPESEVQYIIKLKEIKQSPNESIWDFDQ